eukprot:748710-Hanusia_phi.AAC.1
MKLGQGSGRLGCAESRPGQARTRSSTFLHLAEAGRLAEYGRCRNFRSGKSGTCPPDRGPSCRASDTAPAGPVGALAARRHCPSDGPIRGSQPARPRVPRPGGRAVTVEAVP